MVTFLEEVIDKLKSAHGDISNCTLILPSKRAGGFLKNYLGRSSIQTAFAPKIISIEEFIEELSGLKIVDNTELLFKSYEAYLNISSISVKEDFETFSSWAITLLNDFNEIDRYLVDPKPFFSYLVSIKTLERWGVQDEKTELITNYLQFWESLPEFYENIHALLLKDGVGYQGMVYREAASIMEHYKTQHDLKPHVFIGFNALNTAEQQIVQELLETGNTEIYWDADQLFYEDTKHSASYFIRKYIKEWKYFQSNKPKIIANNFEKEKHFQFVEIQKNIGQVKYVGELLATYSEEQLDKTTIVLGDENLLLPLLYSLPPNVQSLNITMGAPLKMFPAVVFFELLFTIHLHETESLYYKDVSAILNHPLGNKLIPNATTILQQLSRDNITHISPSVLIELSGKAENHLLKLLFENWKNSSSKALEVCLQLLTELQNRGVKDILIACVDGLKGFPDAINTVYPEAQVQLCIVHMVVGDALAKALPRRLARAFAGEGIEKAFHRRFGCRLAHLFSAPVLFKTHRVLDKVARDLLDVAADIADFGELGRLDLYKGCISQLCEAPADLGLAAAGGADHQDVLRRHFIAQLGRQSLPPPAVAKRDRNGALGVLLPDDMFVESGDNRLGSEVLVLRIEHKRGCSQLSESSVSMVSSPLV